MTGDDDATFRTYLSELRETGAGVVVTGETQRPVRAAASRRLFGRPDSPYARILVCPNRRCHATHYLPPESGTESETRVFTGEPSISSRPADSPLFRGTPTATRDTRIVDRRESAATHPRARLRRSEPLSGLERAVLTTIDELCATESDSSQLRVGVTSIRPVAEAVGRDTAMTFCRSIIEATRRMGGLAHLHVPIADDAVRHSQLRDTADVRVELRSARGEWAGAHPEWRWHPPAHVRSTPTEWLPL